MLFAVRKIQVYLIYICMLVFIRGAGERSFAFVYLCRVCIKNKFKQGNCVPLVCVSFVSVFKHRIRLTNIVVASGGILAATDDPGEEAGPVPKGPLVNRNHPMLRDPINSTIRDSEVDKETEPLQEYRSTCTKSERRAFAKTGESTRCSLHTILTDDAYASRHAGSSLKSRVSCDKMRHTVSASFVYEDVVTDDREARVG